MARDFSYRPVQAAAKPRGPRDTRLYLLLALVAVNVAVFVYHGDPRDRLPPPAPVRKPTARVAPVVPGHEAGPFAAGAGLRTPGEVQRVEHLKVRSGETVAQALTHKGVPAVTVAAVLKSLEGLVDFRRVRAGEQLVLRLDGRGALVELDLQRSAVEHVRTRLSSQAWRAKKIDLPITTLVARVHGVVRGSLWEALASAGEDPRLAMHVVDIFAWDVDFYSDLQSGDEFTLLVEKRYVDGKFAEYGVVQAAELVNGGLARRAFAHKRSGTEGANYAYYDSEGQSLRKQMLKSPLKYAHVTSRFGSRVHPVLGYTRAHLGVDYSAPIGTPVWAVADGRVLQAGWNGGAGKMVEIKHTNGWTSQYFHLSQIHVKVGQRVSQKDVVASSGNTGLSSGPHLHYGLKLNGRAVDPGRQKFERAEPLRGAELQQFQNQVRILADSLADKRMARQADAAPSEG